jgi:hypothetical protein
MGRQRFGDGDLPVDGQISLQFVECRVVQRTPNALKIVAPKN